MLWRRCIQTKSETWTRTSSNWRFGWPHRKEEWCVTKRLTGLKKVLVTETRSTHLIRPPVTTWNTNLKILVRHRVQKGPSDRFFDKSVPQLWPDFTSLMLVLRDTLNHSERLPRGMSLEVLTNLQTLQKEGPMLWRRSRVGWGMLNIFWLSSHNLNSWTRLAKNLKWSLF